MPLRLRFLVPFALALSCATAPTKPSPSPAAPATAFMEAPAPATRIPDEPTPGLRLPQDVRPLGYDLTLTTDPRAERFSGSVDLAVRLTRARRTIWLHARELRVSRAEVRVGERTIPATFAPARDDGLASLSLAEAVGPGDAVLSLRFSGAFNLQNDGLYKVTTAGESYAFTQFESISARLAFPCFDEPGFKVPLTLHLIVPANVVTAANTPIAKVTPRSDGTFQVDFKPTAPLPTYLYAWVVGPFDVVEAPALPPTALRAHPLALRGLAVKGRGPELRDSLALAAPILTHLEAYFGLAYPFEKLDLVAVPDFQAGAMENAGLVTFRDTLLLANEKTAPIRLRKRMPETLAHELAHQWFGDRVTMAWWDDVWLNESFAEWLTFPISAQVRPTYGFPMESAAETRGAMEADSLVSARQIRQPILTDGDIFNAFDGITYSKGAAVIGMFERYLGHEIFRQGIHDYLVAHAQGSATVDDLLGALSAASGKDVATPFKTFLDQPGVPLVKAERVCHGKAAALVLTQSRFFPVGSKGDAGAPWQIPICARYDAGQGKLATACTLLTGRSGALALPGTRCPAFVHPNADGAGYYRWSLPGPQLARLAHAKGLTDTERLSLTSSIHAGYVAAVIPAAEALAALQPLARDPEPQIAGAYGELLAEAKATLVSPALRPAVMKATSAAYLPVLAELGYAARSPDEDPRLTARRALVLGLLSRTAEDAGVRAELAKRGRAYLGLDTDGKIHPGAVDPSLAVTAIADALAADPRRFAGLVERLEDEQDLLARRNLLSALGSTRVPAESQRVLALALDPKLRVNEVLDPLWLQARDPRTRPAAWTWLTQNFDAVVARLPAESRSDLPGAFDGFCDEASASEVKAFLEPKMAAAIPGGARVLAQTLESIHLCAARVAAQRASADAFFSRR